MLNGWSSELQENSSWNKRIKNIFDEKVLMIVQLT